MKTKETLVVSLDLNWRVLLLLLGILILLLAASQAATVRGDSPPDINGARVEPPIGAAQSAPLTIPQRPASVPADATYTINGEWVSPSVTGVAPAVVAPAAAGGRRSFYMTIAPYYTNQVLTACAAGYHMASLWEILDVSSLTYSYLHPAAYRQADSGFGPPSAWNGWIRTGYSSSASSSTGTGNCSAWTSTLTTDFGVAVKLSPEWTTASSSISPWIGGSFPCNFNGPVWCVGD